MNNSEFVPPSKIDIKTKYGISNDDFEILTTPRSPRFGEILEQAGDYLGIPVRILKRCCTPAAVVVAVIFYPCWLPDARVKAEKHLTALDDTYAAPFRNLPKQSVPWIPLAGQVAVTANAVTSTSNVVFYSPDSGKSLRNFTTYIDRA